MSEQPARRIDPTIVAALLGGIFTVIATLITVLAANNNNAPAAPTVGVVVVTATAAQPAPTPTPTHTSAVPDTAPSQPTNMPLAEMPTLTPTVAATISTAPQVTTAPTGWVAIQLSWTNEVLFWYNPSTTTLRASQLLLQSVDGGATFSGERWARFGREIFPQGCMRLDEAGTNTRPARPSGCTQVNASIATAGNELVWRSDFQVYWGGVLVGNCTAQDGVCRVYVPPS